MKLSFLILLIAISISFGGQMKMESFWEIIDRIHLESKGVMDTKCSLIAEELKKLSKEELKDFSASFDQTYADTYTWELWGAAYILHGGCSDDAFDDFRSTLISMGKEIYSEALKDPNSLAKVTFEDNDPCYEGFKYAVSDAIEEGLGEIPDSGVEFPREPSGKEWDENEVGNLFPDLKYLGDEESSSSFSESMESDALVENFNIPKAMKKPWWKFWERDRS